MNRYTINCYMPIKQTNKQMWRHFANVCVDIPVQVQLIMLLEQTHGLLFQVAVHLQPALTERFHDCIITSVLSNETGFAACRTTELWLLMILLWHCILALLLPTAPLCMIWSDSFNAVHFFLSAPMSLCHLLCLLTKFYNVIGSCFH